MHPTNTHCSGYTKLIVSGKRGDKVICRVATLKLQGMRMLLSQENLDRFDEKFLPEPNSGCWLWMGTIRGDGYGVFFAADKTRIPAHRVSYERWIGKIPKGLVIDHKCRVISCVNPQHLEAVTNQENVRRGALLKTHCPSGHPYSGDNLYLYKGKHRQCIRCMKQHRANYYIKNRTAILANKARRTAQKAKKDTQ